MYTQEQFQEMIAEIQSTGSADVAEITQGTLASSELMVEEQESWCDEDPSKDVDFTAAPYWIWTDEVTPIYDLDDLNAYIEGTMNFYDLPRQ